MTDMKQPKNWRRMLADLGGYENGLINIPAAGVIPIIDEVEQLRAKLDELEEQEPYKYMGRSGTLFNERIPGIESKALYLAAGARPVEPADVGINGLTEAETAATASCVGLTERTAKDYAIERRVHGRGRRELAAVAGVRGCAALARAESDDVEDVDIHDTAVTRSALTSTLRSNIYEFRKRRDRAMRATSQRPQRRSPRKRRRDWTICRSTGATVDLVTSGSRFYPLRFPYRRNAIYC